MSDLLADLQVDRQRTPSAAAPRAVPALELRVTPLHWAAPALARQPGGWVATGGPWRLSVTV